MFGSLTYKFGVLKIKFNVTRAKRMGMVVGDNFRCMGGVNFGSEPYLIQIGSHVTVSFDVVFINHDGATWVFRDAIKEMNNITKYGPIFIGDNCFIGARAMIMPNSSIGDNCVIAAGSVVAGIVESNSVMAGVPARYIMSYDDYINKCRMLGQAVGSVNKQKELLELFGL